MMKFTGGTADGSNFKLIPEMDDVQVTFVRAEPYEQNPNRLKFIFRIDDYDEDEYPKTEPDIVGTEHWESANVPNNKINPKHRLHFLLTGLLGHTLQDGEDVVVEDYFGNEYKADIKQVPAQTPNGDGSFSIRKDEQGKVVMKAQISRLKPIKKSRRAATPNPFDEEDAA